MKRKTLILTLIIAIGVVLFSGGSANAEEGWFICTVDAAGPNQSGIYISLTDTSYTQAFKKKWFRSPDNRSNEMLATALTAMTNNMKVSVVVDSNQVYGDINIMYLLSQEY
jgi:hypothetical protein